MKKGLLLLLILACSIFISLLKPENVSAQSLHHFEFNNFTGGGAKIAGVPFQITITAKDSIGITVTSFNEQVILSDDTDTIYPTLTGNFQNGIWTGTVYVTEAVLEDHIYASYNTVSGTSNVFAVNPDRRIKFITITGGNNQSGTVYTQLGNALSLRVVDPFSNPISGEGVSFAITGYPAGATGQQLSSTTATTNASGVASTALTLGRKSGTYIVTANLVSGITNAAHFYETAIAGPTISLSISPSLGVLPTESFMAFTAKGYDEFLNEKTLTNLTWSVINGGGTIDQTGVFYAGTEVGNYLNTVKADIGTVGALASVSIISEGGGSGSGGEPTPTPEPTTPPTVEPTPTATASPSATPEPTPLVISEVIVDPEFISALSGATIPITATAIDAYGTPVSGVTYNFEISGDLGTLSEQSGGTVLLTASETGVGTVTISATQGNITKVAKIVGSVGTGLNRRLIIEEIPSPQRVGEPFLISIAAKDSLNQQITDYEGPLAIVDTTGTIDPAVASPSASGLWYVQGIISLAHDEVTVTVAGDGMIGVSNIFAVEGDPKKSDTFPGGLGGIKGASIAAQIQDFLKGGLGGAGGTGVKYIGAGIAAGVGILGASVGGGIMVSRGLEAIGRNPFAKKRLQLNLYGSILAFVVAAGLAVAASFLILG